MLLPLSKVAEPSFNVMSTQILLHGTFTIMLKCADMGWRRTKTEHNHLWGEKKETKRKSVSL